MRGDEGRRRGGTVVRKRKLERRGRKMRTREGRKENEGRGGREIILDGRDEGGRRGRG